MKSEREAILFAEEMIKSLNKDPCEYLFNTLINWLSICLTNNANLWFFTNFSLIIEKVIILRTRSADQAAVLLVYIIGVCDVYREHIKYV